MHPAGARPAYAVRELNQSLSEAKENPMELTRLGRTLLCPALLGVVLASGGCANDEAADDAAAPADSAASAAAPAPAPPSPAAPAVTDAQIAAIVVAANQVDIQAGEMAREKGTNAQVKEFGSRMVTDHTGVNEQASALVTRLGVTPEENPTSQQLTQGGEQTRQRLQGLSGAEFDRAYIDNEVTYHQTVLDAIDNTLIPSAQNGELKALLEQVRPAVAAHLDMARQIQSSLGGA